MSKNQIFEEIVKNFTLHHSAMIEEERQKIASEHREEGVLLVTATDPRFSLPDGPKKVFFKDYLNTLSDNHVRLLQALMYCGYESHKVNLAMIKKYAKDLDPKISCHVLVGKLRAPIHIKNAIKNLNNNIDLDSLTL